MGPVRMLVADLQDLSLDWSRQIKPLVAPCAFFQLPSPFDIGRDLQDMRRHISVGASP